MAQISGFVPTTQVKHVFDYKMFDVANQVACLNGEMVPEERLHMRPFQFHLNFLKEHWRFPQSLDSLLPSTETFSAHLEWWQNPTNVMKGTDLHPKTTVSNSLETPQTKAGALTQSTPLLGSVVRPGNKATHKCSRAESGFSGPSKFQGTVLVATDNSTVVAYINKQGGTHSAEICALLWKIMTGCRHYQISLKARHIPGCLNVMADLLSRSNQVQSTECFKQICLKWFTPHVDLLPLA